MPNYIPEERKKRAREAIDAARSILLLEVEHTDSTAIWEPTYTFDEIYEAALEGRVVCRVRCINSLDATEVDMLSYVPLENVGLANHENGRFVSFVDHSTMETYSWTSNGFAYLVD